MQGVRPEKRNELDRICDIYRLDDLLVAAFRGSDYRFGTLHFAEPMGEGAYPEFIAEPPECLKGGWTWHHEIPMVLHPKKGALLLAVVSLFRDEPVEMLRERIEEEHSELISLEWKIRERLEESGYWQDRPIVMGVGLVTSLHVPDALRPENVPEKIVIDRVKLPRFVDHIDALFEHYATPAAEPVEEWGDRLVEDITAKSTQLGSFVDEERLIESYEDGDEEFEGLVEPAVGRGKKCA